MASCGIKYDNAIGSPEPEVSLRNIDGDHIHHPYPLNLIMQDSEQSSQGYTDLQLWHMSCNMRVSRTFDAPEQKGVLLTVLPSHWRVETSGWSVWGIHDIGWGYQAWTKPSHWVELGYIAMRCECHNLCWRSMRGSPIKSRMQLLINQIKRWGINILSIKCCKTPCKQMFQLLNNWKLDVHVQVMNWHCVCLISCREWP